MTFVKLNRSRMQYSKWLLALLLVILCESGCSEGQPVKEPTVSVPDTATTNPATNTPPAVTASPPAISTPSAAIQLTDVAAEKLTDIMQERGEAYLLVSVNVAENCTGFQYAMKLGQPEPEDRYELSVIKNLKVAIEKDDARFLQGTVLDYLQEDERGQMGFKFNNPHEDVMLLPEYQKLAEQGIGEWELNKKKAESLDPQKALAELATSNRQSAHESLRNYNKYFGPHAETSPPKNGRSGRYDYDRDVTHVMQIPDSAGEILVVVFTNGPEGEPRGGFSLYDNQGREIDIYKNCDYLEEDATFSDINGDGVWEISQTNNGGTSLDDGSRCNYRSFFIATLGRDPKPLLNILFEAQKLVRDSEWKCRLVPASVEGIFDVVLEKPNPGGMEPVATYQWDEAKQQYGGPLSGPGFIAFLGEISMEEAKAFLNAEIEQ